MTQLAALIEKAKNGKKIKDIFGSPLLASSALASSEEASNIKEDTADNERNGLSEQLAILEALLLREDILESTDVSSLAKELDAISRIL